MIKLLHLPTGKFRVIADTTKRIYKYKMTIDSTIMTKPWNSITYDEQSIIIGICRLLKPSSDWSITHTYIRCGKIPFNIYEWELVEDSMTEQEYIKTAMSGIIYD